VLIYKFLNLVRFEIPLYSPLLRGMKDKKTGQTLSECSEGGMGWEKSPLTRGMPKAGG